MKSDDIVQRRLQNQCLLATPHHTPADVVGWLGAVQSQDYAGAKWALGLRLPDAREHEIEAAFAVGALLRTHVMRPTWHFVTPADIRWLLALTAPRVHATNAYYYRKVGLDEAFFARSDAVLAATLRGGNHLTRDELKALLQEAGVSLACADPALRLTLIMMHAELDGVVCSGARRGKQFTYALLDERVPPTPPKERDEALAELTCRYFTSHGPATLQDYVWWSGLATADAAIGLDLVKARLLHEEIAGQTYWFADAAPPLSRASLTAYLLPNYDEYLVGYTDRNATIDATYAPEREAIFAHTIIINGTIRGTWKRVFKQGKALISTTLFATLTDAETRALSMAVAQYGTFLGMPAILGERNS